MILKNKLLSIQIDSSISDDFILLFKSKIKEYYELNFKYFNNFDFLKKIYNKYLIQIRVLYKETISKKLEEFCFENNVKLIIEDFSNNYPQKEEFISKGYICGCRIFIDKRGIIKYGSCKQCIFNHLNSIKDIYLLKQICNQKKCKGVNILYLEK